MRSEELRIGNWVKFFDEATEREMNGGDFMYPDLIDPIPLTEEWLEKFGFTYDGYAWITGVLVLIKPHSNGGYYIQNWTGTIEIKYVHQLQNLYFVLTEKELKTINDEMET